MQVGYVYDHASYYRARYYHSNTGRFLSEDPIRFQGGINFYQYVRNNPLNWTDPWGNQTRKDCYTLSMQGIH
ncbi:MAG TPA: RHS repeat-associated core domain-containing protein [Candidatus Angelobacter sp.]|nr:RHS repeat-associated core domain-containing protein [Candidatus Angelobacter sp.]